MVPLLLEHPKVNNQEFLSLFANLVRFGPFEFYILVIICNIFFQMLPHKNPKSWQFKTSYAECSRRTKRFRMQHVQ